jgi:hypothetical protein
MEAAFLVSDGHLFDRLRKPHVMLAWLNPNRDDSVPHGSPGMGTGIRGTSL